VWLAIAGAADRTGRRHPSGTLRRKLALSGLILERLGGRTRARTWDPMIKSLPLMPLHQQVRCKICDFQA
jgi:hypothetical protein